MLRYGLMFFLVISSALCLFGQESKLAQQYYENGEYEKASSLYHKLYEQQNYNDYYFERYVECLINLEEYEECEKAIKKQIKKRPNQVQLYVTYGNLFERQYMEEEAAKQYETAVEQLTADRFIITKLSNAFSRLTKFDLAIKAYEKGSKLLKDDQVFAYNLADLYRRKGNHPKMIEYYLNSMDANPTRMSSIKTLFQRYFEEEDYQILQTQLYERVQKDRDAIHYPEMLSWVFIQKKDYKNAFRQERALDRKLEENGTRVYRLAEIAHNDKDYDTAIAAYEYIVEDKGITCLLYTSPSPRDRG